MNSWDLGDLILEYRETYLHGDAETIHKRLLLEARDTGRRNYEKVLDLKSRGEDYTDAVLYGLLPHLNSPYNRQKGSWIHIAPCVTRDIKEWFEGAGWVDSRDWPTVAAKLLDFFQAALGNPAGFASICARFSEQYQLKGFQVGMLTPILNALDPVNFLVVNKKPILALNWFTRSKYRAKVEELPVIMNAIRKWVEQNRAAMESITLSGTTVYDAFDTFTHWLKAEKRVYEEEDAEAEGEVETDMVAPPRKLPIYQRYGRGNPDAAKDMFRRIFTGDENRKAAEDFLAECIALAHRGNENNWQITKGKVNLRFNVGFCRILRYDRSKVRLFMLADGLTAEVREKYHGQLEISRAHFKSLGGLETAKIDLSPWLFKECFEDFKPHVFRFIELNSPQSNSSIWEFSHSPGVLEYLRRDTGKVIPSPRFEPALLEKIAQGEIPDTESEDANEGAEGADAYPAEDAGVASVSLVEEIQPAYTIPEFSRDTGFPESRLAGWMEALSRKGQAILFGPPGTGKTFLAQRIARHIVAGGDGFVDSLQFHPSYSYEEFIEGIRPVTDGKGGLRFEQRPGRFLEFCDRARLRRGECVLILDEVNRANLSRVFGELMYLLEYRTQEISLAGGRRFAIPGNVRIIGTMNTADRSIALVDFAMRRRFAFLELAPEYDILQAYQSRLGFDSSGLLEVLREVNGRINDRNFNLGLSFFMVASLGAQIEAIWKTEIEPYLEEYFFGQQGAVEAFRWAKVADRILR